MTYIMQDQVGMILRIKWVCFEKAEPRGTDQPQKEIRHFYDVKSIVIFIITKLPMSNYITKPTKRGR